jgi:hypothetical protein
LIANASEQIFGCGAEILTRGVFDEAAERNRLLKVLETANIKLANVATDVFGMSGRLMLRSLIAEKATPQEMADLAKGLLRKKIPELELALEGKLEQHHRFLLQLQLQRLEAAKKTWLF